MLTKAHSGTGYYEQYFKDYAYRHVPVALGLNESRNIGFSFSIEEVGMPLSFALLFSTTCRNRRRGVPLEQSLLHLFLQVDKQSLCLQKVTPTSGQGEQPGMPAEANEPSYIYSTHLCLCSASAKIFAAEHSAQKC